MSIAHNFNDESLRLLATLNEESGMLIIPKQPHDIIYDTLDTKCYGVFNFPTDDKHAILIIGLLQNAIQILTKETDHPTHLTRTQALNMLGRAQDSLTTYADIKQSTDKTGADGDFSKGLYSSVSRGVFR